MLLELALLIAALLAVLAAVYRSVRIVPQDKVDVLERYGRFHRTLEPGTHRIIPFVDQVRARVDLREQVLTVPPERLTAADGRTAEAEATVTYRVTDARAALYQVADVRAALGQLTLTIVRNVLDDRPLDQALGADTEVSTILRNELPGLAAEWGLRINDVAVRISTAR